MRSESGLRSFNALKYQILLFLTQIKLVNINSTDIVDGRPAIVLGLMWTIILYFQVSV